jgi:hypothetical protein
MDRQRLKTKPCITLRMLAASMTYGSLRCDCSCYPWPTRASRRIPRIRKDSYHLPRKFGIPQGRFLRRSSQEELELQEKVEHLEIPGVYLHDPDFDDTVDVLLNMDSEFIPFWQTPMLLDETDIPNHIPLIAHETCCLLVVVAYSLLSKG